LVDFMGKQKVKCAVHSLFLIVGDASCSWE
jgi:hypothetical protein